MSTPADQLTFLTGDVNSQPNDYVQSLFGDTTTGTPASDTSGSFLDVYQPQDVVTATAPSDQGFFDWLKSSAKDAITAYAQGAAKIQAAKETNKAIAARTATSIAAANTALPTFAMYSLLALAIYLIFRVIPK